MYKYLIIIFFFLSSYLYAENVRQFEVEGNKRISKETIKVYGDIKLKKDYSSLDTDKILKNLYKTNFFEDIKISINNEILKILVKEYPVINSIALEGEKANKIKSKILELLLLKSKESFIESNLSDDVDKIKKIYASMGYNFTTVNAKVERFSEDRINLIYFVEKGKKTSIGKIEFTGDKKIKDKRLRDVIVSEEDKFWKFLSNNVFLNYNNIKLDERLLVNHYKSLGYYDVQVLSNNAEISNDNKTILTYTINAGVRYKVKKISTNVSDVFDKKLFVPMQKSFTKIIGKYYSPFKVKKLLDELDLLIAGNELQFVEHSVNEILEGEFIEIKINIYEGNKALIERVDIVGNTVTNEAVIRSTLLLDEGDPFNKLKLEQTIAKLKARNIFGEIKNTVTEGSKKDLKIIGIEVEEKATGEISAGAGIGTDGGSFAFSITENNWLGKGMGVSTSIELGAETFSGTLSVTDPDYKYSGNALSYFVNNSVNDKPDAGYKNTVYSAGIGTNFEQYRNIYISPRLVYALDDLELKSTASKSLEKQKGSFSDLSLDYGISLDNRDKVYAPTDGYISSFRQSLPIYADSPYLSNSYSFSKYYAFSPDAVGTFKIHTAAVTGLDDKDVRLTKRLHLSKKRLRGFKQGMVGPKDGIDYVGGNYMMASNFEVALPNVLPESTKTDIGVFLDFGNLWKVDYDSTVEDSNKIRSSAGMNIAWISPIGPMTFVIAKNITKATTDQTEVFSFNLGTTF